MRTLAITTVLLLAACGNRTLPPGDVGPGGPGPIRPPSPPATSGIEQAGITAAAGGPGTIRVEHVTPPTGFAMALFAGSDPATLYQGTPIVPAATGTFTDITGRADGEHFIGAAVRATTATNWTPIGAIVRARTGNPVYVDAAANPAIADGMTPATAFPSLQDGMLVAAAQGGGLVWVKDGDYHGGPFALGPGVHVYGGFATFALADRAPRAERTRLLTSSGLQMIEVLTGGQDGVLDGLALDGNRLVTEGIDVADSDIELRAVTARRFLDRGMRVRNTSIANDRHVTTVACLFAENDADGVGSSGFTQLNFDRTRFESNGQEGADIDNLEAPDGQRAALLATGCRFFGNALEGLDVDLAAPLATTTTLGGTMLVELRACAFERNGLDGLLVDQEHEFFPLWRTELRVLDCVARANRRAGVHVDADAFGSWTIDGLRATANGTDGVLITSESFAGDAWLSRSWLCGNLGAGARTALGNVALHASHCAFAGNRLGGMLHERLTGSAASSIAWQQPASFTGSLTVGCIDAAGGTAVFRAAPVAFAAATAQANGVLTLDGSSPFAANMVVELADDGIRRVATQSSGVTVVLDATPTLFVPPESVMGFAVDFVTEDLRLTDTSAARGQGMTAPGGTAIDPGPLGGAVNREPGIADPTAAPLLRPLRCAPATAVAVAATSPITVTFDRALDAATFTSTRVRVIGTAGDVAANINVAGATLTLAPPAGGWPTTLHVELHAGLRATDGSALGTPTALPFHR